jgi:GT2 family glycosyltransferase
MKDLFCSVVIPSFNRKETLSLVLEGLQRQTLPYDLFEVIVVLDGSTDGSNRMLEAWQKERGLINLRWILQQNQGQASARNNGAEAASAPLLVFLDDDVVPEPGLLEAHLSWHKDRRSVAVLGDARVVLERRDSLYHLGFWAWWEDKYHRRSLPFRKFCSRDFCSGNFSIRKEDFLKVGGFDNGFRQYGGEDYELGYRLLKSGVELVVDRRASAQHFHRTSVEGVLKATRQEAHGDLLIGTKHPELKPGLRISRLPEGGYLWVVRLAVGAPLLGDLIFLGVSHFLPWLEKAKMRMKWQWLFNLSRGYAYWRGVRDVFGSWKKLRSYQNDQQNVSEISLDISAGIPDNLDKVWVEGPSLINVEFNGRHLGSLEIETVIEEPLPERLAAEMRTKLQLPLALAFFTASPSPVEKPDEETHSRRQLYEKKPGSRKW